MTQNWYTLGQKHKGQATFDFYCGPFDTTFDADLQTETLSPDATRPALGTPPTYRDIN